MIRIVETSSIQDKKQALSKFESNQDILLVASLNDKLFWRNHFFSQTDLLLDDSVQRASDFWQKLLLYVNQPYQLVSPAFLKTFLNEFVAEKKLSLQSETLYRLLVDFQDVLYSDDLYEIFDEWAAENIAKEQAWLEHIEDLRTIVAVLEKEKWITRDLLPALLLKYSSDILSVIEGKNIFVSLDFSLTIIETKLLKALAEANTVNVLLPRIEPLQNFIWDYQVYKPLAEDTSVLKDSRILDSLFKEKKPVVGLQLPESKIQYCEFDSIINEVLFVIGKIRELLSQGVAVKDIAILSVNKERYTLLFDTFLQIEGLHSQSTQDSNLLGVKYLQYIIGKLKLKTNQMETEELELATYYKAPSISYDSYAKHFTNLYHAEETKDLLKKQNIHVDEKSIFVDKFQFMDWLLEDELDMEAQSLTGLLNDIPDKVIFSKNSWIQYFQQVLQNKFLRKSTIHDGVMQVLDVLESSLQQNKHVFILGLNDKDLRERQNAFIEQSEIEKLSKDLGLLFPSHFSQNRLLAILQIINEENKVYLSYSKVDANADLLEPGLFHFLLQKQNHNLLPSHNLSAFDSKQSDMTVPKDLPWKIQKLSATQIESYVKCPFVFYAKNILKLPDQDPLDLDVDPMTNGNIVHYTLASLVALPTWPNLSKTEIENALSDAVEHFKPQIKEVDLIPSYVNKAKEYIHNFATFEKSWRLEFPKTKTIGVEHELKVFLDRNGYFHKESAPDRYPFTAKMDRIDTDQNGNYLIIDYKFKLSSQHTNIGTWFSKGSFQLAMYALLLEDIKPFEDFQSVIGGLYFSLKPIQRKKGFLLKNHTNLYNSMSGGRTLFIDEEQKQNYFSQLREIIKNVITRIEDGNFQATPLNQKDCDTCHWRNTCRASHLN
jgi:ATP-dependent helicase/nuclease subunit B